MTGGGDIMSAITARASLLMALDEDTRMLGIPPSDARSPAPAGITGDAPARDDRPDPARRGARPNAAPDTQMILIRNAVRHFDAEEGPLP